MKNYEVVIGKSKIELSHDDLSDIDVIRTGSKEYNSISNHQSYSAVIEHVDIDEKIVELRLNGKFITCQISDELDLMIRSMKLGSSKKGKSKHLFSNMPGLVLSIMVNEGQQISAGDPLMILEAMKMENVLKANSDGVVSKINCSEKDAVDKGQLLIEIE